MKTLNEWTIWSSDALFAMFRTIVKTPVDEDTTDTDVITDSASVATFSEADAFFQSFIGKEQMLMENCCAVTSYAEVAALAEMKNKTKFNVDFPKQQLEPELEPPKSSKKSVRDSQKDRRQKEKQLREEALVLNRKLHDSPLSLTKSFTDQEIKLKPSKYYQFAVTCGAGNDELYPIIGMQQIAEKIQAKRNRKRKFRKHVQDQEKAQTPNKKEVIIDEDGFQLVCNKRKHRPYEKKPTDTNDDGNNDLNAAAKPDSDPDTKTNTKKSNRKNKKRAHKQNNNLKNADADGVSVIVESVVNTTTESAVFTNKAIKTKGKKIDTAVLIKTSATQKNPSVEVVPQFKNKMCFWRAVLEALKFIILVVFITLGTLRAYRAQDHADVSMNVNNESYR